ncbi:MAG: hypothetical protein V3W20_09350 [Candidatus Neomarinimicrobiota bacterium]
MKNLCIIALLLITAALPPTGCATFGSNNGNWQNNIQQIKDDVFMFGKLATRVALIEAKMPAEDVKLIEGYLVALRDLLSIPGQPDFTGARALVEIKLPPKYQVYGLIIIDLLERYLKTANLDVTEDHEAIITLISAGINGALVAVQEFAG